MTPGMLRQVIRQAQAERLNRSFDMQARMFVMGAFSGALLALLMVKLLAEETMVSLRR